MRFWKEILIGLLLLGIAGWVLYWILAPLFFKKDIEVATNQIVATTETSVDEKKEVSKETNANAAKSIRRTQERTLAAATTAASSPDGDAAFYEFVCNTRLYRADPQRESKGCGGRKD